MGERTTVQNGQNIRAKGPGGWKNKQLLLCLVQGTKPQNSFLDPDIIGCYGGTSTKAGEEKHETEWRKDFTFTGSLAARGVPP